MELSKNQAALIPGLSETGEINVDVAAADLDGLPGSICPFAGHGNKGGRSKPPGYRLHPLTGKQKVFFRYESMATGV